MAKNSRRVRKIAKALGASRVIHVGKRWKDWMTASLVEKKLCVCGTVNKHLPHCPYNEIGVDFSDIQKVLKKLDKDLRKLEKPRNPKRIPMILKKLEKIWKKNPDLRLGQLLENAIKKNLYYMEDEKLMDELEKFYKNKNRR